MRRGGGKRGKTPLADRTMSTNPPASEYLLLFRNNAWYQDLAPDVIEESMNRFTAWADKLSREGKLKGGGPLEAMVKTLISTDLWTHGHFVELITHSPVSFCFQ